MKKIIFAVLVFLPMIAIAQKPNLDKLPENERNEYLLKTALPLVLKHAPEWYSDYKEPKIFTFVMEYGPEKGRRVYSVWYPQDPQKMEEMEFSNYSVAISFWADTGEVNVIGFGDGWGFGLPKETKTRSGEQAKPFYRPNPYLKK